MDSLKDWGYTLVMDKHREQPPCSRCGLPMWWVHSLNRHACRSCEDVPSLMLGGHREDLCRGCGGKRFWRGRYRDATCVTCHPPAFERFVVEYLEGRPPPPEPPLVAPELITALQQTIQRGKRRGTSREVLDWEFGGHELVGEALVRLMSREKKRACSTRQSQEVWYYRR